MIYKASYDTFAYIITTIFLLVFGIAEFVILNNLMHAKHSGLTVVINAGLILILDAVFFTAYLMSIDKYKLTADELIIIKNGINRKIKREDIINARLLSSEEKSMLRRKVGSGGLFGYFGKFTHPQLGGLNVFATNKKKLLLIEIINAEPILISPDNINLCENILKNDE